MKRSLFDISPIKTSHAVGQKRVLLAAQESGCSLTQIAVTDLKAGEVAAAHVHPDMQEAFYVMDGQLEVVLDGEKQLCEKDDFVFVRNLTSHELRAVTDVRMMTIGCVIEAHRNKLYPMLFEPNLRTMVWGGEKLTQWKQLPAQDNIGESWEVSVHPSYPSTVANGTWAGYQLDEVIAQNPTAILGRQVAKAYKNQLPLLVKFIDAQQDLSIQVHPNDEMARRVHGGSGKTEMWYVIDAEPGACLYAGFSEELTAEEFKELVRNSSNHAPEGLSNESNESFVKSTEDTEGHGNSFEETTNLHESARIHSLHGKKLTDVLAKHEVHAGDVFYLPAGRVHAICGGILLAEVQQSSDLTYRIYDYNRPGLDGKPRELHTELAAEALDYKVYKEYRTDYEEHADTTNTVIRSPYFTVKVAELTEPMHRNMILKDSFVIVMCLRGECKIRVRSTGDEILLHEANSCLIPAAVADYDVTPVNGTVRLLDAYIDPINKSIGDIITLFKHITTRK